MTTKYTDAEKFLNKLRGGPLTFGRMIESLRKCDEIPQVELAQKIKVSKAFLCDIEKGRRVATPAIAAKLAKAMGYAVQQFVAKALEDQLRSFGMKMKVHLEAA